MSTSPWRIRRIEEDDPQWEEILELDKQPEYFGGCYWSKPQESTLFVCEARTREGWDLAAYASYRPASVDPGDQGVVFLDRAATVPHYRGRGLQRKMIRRRLESARADGARAAITYTMHGLARSANNLIRCGFRLYVPQYPWAGSRELYWYRKL